MKRVPCVRCGTSVVAIGRMASRRLCAACLRAERAAQGPDAERALAGARARARADGHAVDAGTPWAPCVRCGEIGWLTRIKGEALCRACLCERDEEPIEVALRRPVALWEAAGIAGGRLR